MLKRRYGCFAAGLKHFNFVLTSLKMPAAKPVSDIKTCAKRSNIDIMSARLTLPDQLLFPTDKRHR